MREDGPVGNVETKRPSELGSTNARKPRNNSFKPSFLDRKGQNFNDQTSKDDNQRSEQIGSESSLPRPSQPDDAIDRPFQPVQQSSIQKSRPKKMSMTTFVQYVHKSQLPLPSPKSGQNPRDVGTKALSVAIALLQSPETMAGLNPLVEKFEQIDPSNPEHKGRLVPLEKLASEFNVDLSENSPSFNHFEITDKFSLPLGYSKNLVYRTAMRNLLNGMESLTDPGSGVTMHAKWTVKESDTHPGEFLELTEVDYIHCNVFLSLYIRSQLDSSHRQLHDGFMQRFMEGMGQPIGGYKRGNYDYPSAPASAS